MSNDWTCHIFRFFPVRQSVSCNAKERCCIRKSKKYPRMQGWKKSKPTSNSDDCEWAYREKLAWKKKSQLPRCKQVNKYHSIFFFCFPSSSSSMCVLVVARWTRIYRIVFDALFYFSVVFSPQSSVDKYSPQLQAICIARRVRCDAIYGGDGAISEHMWRYRMEWEEKL